MSDLILGLLLIFGTAVLAISAGTIIRRYQLWKKPVIFVEDKLEKGAVVFPKEFSKQVAEIYKDKPRDYKKIPKVDWEMAKKKDEQK